MVDEGHEPKDLSSTTREIFEDLKDWSGKVFQKVREEADTLSTKGKLKLDLTTLKSKRGSEFRKLGMRVYHLLEQGKLEIPGAEDNIATIQSLTEEIRDREKKLKDFGQKTSPEEPSEDKEETEGV